MVNIVLNPNFTNIVNGKRDLAKNVKSHSTCSLEYCGKNVIETILLTGEDKWYLCWCLAPAEETLIDGVENPCFFTEMKSDDDTVKARREVHEVFERHYELVPTPEPEEKSVAEPAKSDAKS